MTLRPESLPALEDALVKATGWEARAERLFNDSDHLSLNPKPSPRSPVQLPSNVAASLAPPEDDLS